MSVKLSIGPKRSRYADSFRSQWTSFPCGCRFLTARAPVTALSVRDAVSYVSRQAIDRGWRQSAPELSLAELGLEPNSCGLNFDVLYDRQVAADPATSVVAAAYNCGEQITQFVRSVLSQDTAEPYEVIIIDDGSTDGCGAAAVATAPEAATSVSIRLVRRRRKRAYSHGSFTFGAGAARQIGIELAKGNRVVFLDADQLVYPECVREHASFGKRGFDVVIGDRIDPSGDVGTAWDQLRNESLSDDPNWWLSFYTGNASVDTRILREVGGFDIRLQYWGLDDTDLGYRLFQAGASIWHTCRARVLDLAPDASGGGFDRSQRTASYRLHMEVLYRKYLDPGIIDAFRFVH